MAEADMRQWQTGVDWQKEWIMSDKNDYEYKRGEREWRDALTDEQYRVLRQKGTERAFSGAFWDKKEKGVYACGGCGKALFSSEAKYDSGSGWPSFWKPMDDSRVDEERDLSHGMVRTEIVCSRCGSHLGHVFEDGPRPTGLRYCVNSASLNFTADDDKE